MMTKEKLAELQTRRPGHTSRRRRRLVEEHGDDLSQLARRACARSTTSTSTAAGEILKQIRTAKDDLAIIEKAREIGAGDRRHAGQHARHAGGQGPAADVQGHGRPHWPAQIRPDGRKALAPVRQPRWWARSSPPTRWRSVSRR